MNFFSIRTNDQDSIGKILSGERNIKFGTLSWHRNEVNIDDLVFVVVSGDSAKKKFRYDNGLRAIGTVMEKPKDEADGDHFSIKVKILETLSKSITKDDFYIYPSLKDAPNIGPDTKTPPNQAFRKIEENVGKDIIRAIKDQNEKFKNYEYLKGLIDEDFGIVKLIESQSHIKTNVVSYMPSKSFSLELLQNEFVEKK